MKIVVVDSAKSVRSRLLELLREYSVCEVLGVFESAQDARALKDSEDEIDAFVLGVSKINADLPSLVAGLRQHWKDAAIVIVSDNENMAVRAFELDAVDYLMMPITVARFSETLRRIKERFLVGSPLQKQPLLHVRDRGKHIFLGLNEVSHIEADQGVLTVHTAEKRYLLDGSLKAIQAKYDDSFLRIHRKTLVNKMFISGLDREDGVNMLHLTGVEQPFTVSRRHVSNVTGWVKKLSR